MRATQWRYWVNARRDVRLLSRPAKRGDIKERNHHNLSLNFWDLLSFWDFYQKTFETFQKVPKIPKSPKMLLLTSVFENIFKVIQGSKGQISILIKSSEIIPQNVVLEVCLTENTFKVIKGQSRS